MFDPRKPTRIKRTQKPVRFVRDDNAKVYPYLFELPDGQTEWFTRAGSFRDEAEDLLDLENFEPDPLDAASTTKPSNSVNPKDAIGINKLPLGLIPDTAIALLSLAFLEGASKYGRFNWRAVGVRSSIYHDALRRHIASWWNGEDADPATGIPHLANAAACIAIILDAKATGKLNDDRPPAAEVGALLRSLATEVPRIKALFAASNPTQLTINDPLPGISVVFAGPSDTGDSDVPF